LLALLVDERGHFEGGGRGREGGAGCGVWILLRCVAKNPKSLEVRKVQLEQDESKDFNFDFTPPRIA
jgi:hypothetical protein